MSGQDEFLRRRGEQLGRPAESEPADLRDVLAAGGLDSVNVDHIEEALRVAYEREHALVARVAELEAILETRTIERDHHHATGNLFSLALAAMVDELGGAVDLTIDAIERMHGRALDGHVHDDVVTISLSEIVPPSREAGG